MIGEKTILDIYRQVLKDNNILSDTVAIITSEDVFVLSRHAAEYFGSGPGISLQGFIDTHKNAKVIG